MAVSNKAQEVKLDTVRAELHVEVSRNSETLKSNSLGLVELRKRINRTDTNNAVTTVILKELASSVKEFSKNTKALTEAVIRMDSRIDAIEKTK